MGNNNYIYLLRMKTSGIKNIEQTIELNFYKKTIRNDFNPSKYRVKAIYGENGCGKTAVITAAKILKNVIINQGYLSDSSNQKKLDKIVNKKKKAFNIECEYLLNLNDDMKIYKYELLLELSTQGNYEISHERLSERKAYTGSSSSDIYLCENGRLIYMKDVDLIKQNILVESTLNIIKKQSLVSCLFQEENSTILYNASKPSYIACLANALFGGMLSVSLDSKDQHDLYIRNDALYSSLLDDNKTVGIANKENDVLYPYIDVNGDQVKKTDYDKYSSKVEKLCSFLKIFKKDLREIDIEKRDNGDCYYCELVFVYDGYKVNMEFESAGIKRLIQLFDHFSNPNGIAFIDEMDVNINDVYLCKLIEYFMYYGEGQLCFTTHNTSPMSILRKNKLSIDFLSNDNHIVSWKSDGNFAPENLYRNGMIEYLPFNIEPSDFIGILGE